VLTSTVTFPSVRAHFLPFTISAGILTLLCDLLVWLVGLIGEQNTVYTFRKLLFSLIITSYLRSERHHLKIFFKCVYHFFDLTWNGCLHPNLALNTV